MTRAELEAFLVERDWRKDRFGHYQKDRTGRSGVTRAYRVKLGKISARYEVNTIGVGWTRIASGYYSAMSIAPEGKLAGMGP